MAPISTDYSTESAGLFQNTPRLTTFLGHLIAGIPCTPACRWVYVDRTAEGVLGRVYQHSVTLDGREYQHSVTVPFAALGDTAGVAEQAISSLSLDHHAFIQKQEYLRDAGDIGQDDTERTAFDSPVEPSPATGTAAPEHPAQATGITLPGPEHGHMQRSSRRRS